MSQIQQINTWLNSHPVRIIEPGDRAHAAVALILKEMPNGLCVLFIERSTKDNDTWSGHIAFPGGRREACDSGPQDTAERETSEELGLDLSTAHYIGRLSDVAAGSLKIVVSCFVYVVDWHPVLHPNPLEVADAFWFALSEINNPARSSLVEFVFRKRRRRFPAVRIVDGKESHLWGLTYRLIRNLNKMINQDKSLCVV